MDRPAQARPRGNGGGGPFQMRGYRAIVQREIEIVSRQRAGDNADGVQGSADADGLQPPPRFGRKRGEEGLINWNVFSGDAEVGRALAAVVADVNPSADEYGRRPVAALYADQIDVSVADLHCSGDLIDAIGKTGVGGLSAGDLDVGVDD